jgi:hypothetical protein
MLTSNITSAKRRCFLIGGLVLGGVQVLVPGSADAHFFLDAPPSWMSQTPPPGFGDPQKTGPCGDEGGGTPTGTVTHVDPQTDGTYRVTIMWHDTVPHPGHYRIALAVNSRADLPQEPVVTPSATDQCASAAVVNAPYTLPILADNVNPHTATGLQGNQMVTVTIPASVSCTHCTLQVLEFMSSHGAPCFYHHCADLSMGSATGTGGVAGGTGGTAGRAGGTGGAAGRAGGNNTGGSVAGTGGSTGAGGTLAGTGGRPGTGGSTGTGGALTTGSGGSGTTGSGGRASGSGGASVADGSAGSAGNGGPGASDGGGCSCEVLASRSPTRAAVSVVGVALGLGILLRRRRRQR